MMTIEVFSRGHFCQVNQLAANDCIACWSVVLVPGLWFFSGAGTADFLREKKHAFPHALLSLC